MYHINPGVEFFVNGLFAEAISGNLDTYIRRWNTNNASDGENTTSVTAFDESGNKGSDTITLYKDSSTGGNKGKKRT